MTPFDGLASGVAALVRHLPAGSPAVLFCIHSLVVKAKDLCDTAMVRDKSLWRSWEESTEPCKKTLDLLLRLIFLVDIQVRLYDHFFALMICRLIVVAFRICFVSLPNFSRKEI